MESLPPEILNEVFVGGIDAVHDMRALYETCQRFNAALKGPIPVAAWLCRWRPGLPGLWTRRLDVIRRLVEFHQAEMDDVHKRLWGACHHGEADVVTYLLSRPAVMKKVLDTGPEMCFKLATVRLGTGVYDDAARLRTLHVLLETPELRMTPAQSTSMLKSAVSIQCTRASLVALLGHPDVRVTRPAGDDNTLGPLVDACYYRTPDIIGVLLDHPDMTAEEVRSCFVVALLTRFPSPDVMTRRVPVANIGRVAAHPHNDVNASVDDLGDNAPLLYASCYLRDADVVAELLKVPNIDVNAATHGPSALGGVCMMSPVPLDVLDELLRFPGTDVNLTTHAAVVPVVGSCFRSSDGLEAVRKVLAHPGLSSDTVRACLTIALAAEDADPAIVDELMKHPLQLHP